MDGSYSTVDGGYSTVDGSYSTADGELQHAGWVKMNTGNAAGRCGIIFEQKKVTGCIHR